VAGDETDAARLLRRASRPHPGVEHAVLAVGHLGHGPSTVALASLGEELDPRFAAEARRLTLGDPAAGRRAPSFAGRLLVGRPWTVEGALARLIAPDEPIRSRERLALDLAVRTGVRPPFRYDATATASRQARGAQDFRATFAPVAASLASGRWHYYGYPVPKGG
jgi:hypothetical protein